MELFWSKGFDSTSLADLTATMGINAPSLYAAFGSKERLFIEALDLYSASEGTEIWSPLDSMPTARAAVEHILVASADAFSQPGKPQGCMIALEALHAGATSQKVCGILRDHRAWNFRSIEERIRKAVETGELPETLDIASVANFYATVQHGMSIFARDGASREQLQAVAAGAMTAWEGLTRTASKN